MAPATKADPKSYIGRKGLLTIVPNPKAPENKMQVEVRITDAFAAYNRIDVVAEPVKGSGSVRVTLKSIKLTK